MLDKVICFLLTKDKKGKNIVQKRVKKKRKKNLGFYYMLYGALGMSNIDGMNIMHHTMMLIAKIQNHDDQYCCLFPHVPPPPPNHSIC